MVEPLISARNIKKHFDIGVEFEGIQPEQTAQLRNFIEKELPSHP